MKRSEFKLYDLIVTREGYAKGLKSNAYPLDLADARRLVAPGERIERTTDKAWEDYAFQCRQRRAK